MRSNRKLRTSGPVFNSTEEYNFSLRRRMWLPVIYHKKFHLWGYEPSPMEHWYSPKEECFTYLCQALSHLTDNGYDSVATWLSGVSGDSISAQQLKRLTEEYPPLAEIIGLSYEERILAYYVSTLFPVEPWQPGRAIEERPKPTRIF